MSSETKRLEIILTHLQPTTVTTQFGIMETSAETKDKTTLSSHVLDTSLGVPAQGMGIQLYKQNPSSLNWEEMSNHKTNADGRVREFPVLKEEGIYKVTFSTAGYFKQTQVENYFYPSVDVVFKVKMG